MDLNSIERVGEYLAIPQEPPAIIESNRPPAYWPSSSCETLVRLLLSRLRHGCIHRADSHHLLQISVQDLVIAYSPELPPVIKGISFDLKPKEKVSTTSLFVLCTETLTTPSKSLDRTHRTNWIGQVYARDVPSPLRRPVEVRRLLPHSTPPARSHS